MKTTYFFFYILIIVAINSCGKANWESFVPPPFIELPPEPEPEVVGDTVTVKIMTVGLHANLSVAAVENSMKRYGFMADSLGVDFLVMREVDSSTTRSAKLDRAYILSQESKLSNYLFAAVQEYQTGLYGLAVYSKHPLARKSVYNLQNNRVMGLITAQISEDHQIAVGGVQLEDAANEQGMTRRTAQTGLLLDAIKELSMPVILAGNFFLLDQTPANDATFSLYAAGSFKPGCTTCDWTFPASATVNAIADFIMYKWGGEVEVLRYKVLDPAPGANRKPVFAELKIVI